MLRFAQEWEHMDGGELFRLGLDPNIEWDPRIVDRLIEVGDGWDLYLAGLLWPNDRYDSRIAQALMDAKDMFMISGALGDGYPPWPPERIRDLLMAWQGV